jgi:transposase-like protein
MAEHRISYSNLLRWTEQDCREFLEHVRWPEGPLCPHCGARDPYRITRRSRTKNKVQSLFKCKECKKQFTVTVGTIFEGSKIPLRKWFAAIYIMCAFRRGISAYDVHVQAHITYKSAWYICHRVRETLRGECAAVETAD